MEGFYYSESWIDKRLYKTLENDILSEFYDFYKENTSLCTLLFVYFAIVLCDGRIKYKNIYF